MGLLIGLWLELLGLVFGVRVGQMKLVLSLRLPLRLKFRVRIRIIMVS